MDPGSLFSLNNVSNDFKGSGNGTVVVKALSDQKVVSGGCKF